jgi:hypothetical protein
MKRTQIQIHGSQFKWLKQQAANDGVSMSQLVRDSIDLYRERVERDRGFNHQRQVALDAVGSFSSVKAEARGGRLKA